jgi:hypothetical protein
VIGSSALHVSGVKYQFELISNFGLPNEFA